MIIYEGINPLPCLRNSLGYLWIGSKTAESSYVSSRKTIMKPQEERRVQLTSETVSRVGRSGGRTEFSTLHLLIQIKVFLPSSPIHLFLLSQFPMQSLCSWRVWFKTQYLCGLYKREKKKKVLCSGVRSVKSPPAIDLRKAQSSCPALTPVMNKARREKTWLTPQVEPTDTVGTCTGEVVFEAPV